MTRLAAIAAAALLLASMQAAAARIYRCAEAGGGVTFQDRPCARESEEHALETPEYPAINTAERERLLQREAALDARLAKRAELETAERIAREQRWAAQAEREARAPAEPAYLIPYYASYYGTGLRPPRPVRPTLRQPVVSPHFY